MKYVVGVDLGGTNTKVGLVSEKGTIKNLMEVETEPEKGSKHIVANITKLISAVKTKKIAGIGIGSPGPLDYKTGTIINPVNLPFKNLKLRDVIQRKFKVPTFLDNDANCFALDQAMFGPGKKYEIVVGITLGTGFGGGLVINKQIVHGRGNAAEVGHITFLYNGRRAKSGNSGAVEEYVSKRGIVREYGRVKFNPYDIAKLAEKKQQKAIKTYERLGQYLGIAMANITYAYDPNIIVLGGKISQSWRFFQKSMFKELKKRYFGPIPEVVRSHISNTGVLGAAALVLQKKV